MLQFMESQIRNDLVTEKQLIAQSLSLAGSVNDTAASEMQARS